MNNVSAARKSKWTPQELSLLRLSLEEKLLLFAQYFFRINDGSEFIVNPHHIVICDTLERVLRGEIKRLIINIPPGYTKCVVGGTMVHLPKGEVPVESLKTGDMIMSLCFKKWRAIPRRVLATETFYKDCVEISTESGKKVQVSHDHPVYTRLGWKKAEDVIVGEDRLCSVNPISGNPCFHEKVSVLRKLPGKRKVYHLSVDAEDYDDQNFIANGLVVHNTELAVIYFIARGLAMNPRSRFIHASYSENLTMLNSSKIKDIILSPEYQELWPMELRADSQSKKAWVNTVGGGLYAPPAGGQITGFRAGRSDGLHNRNFSGAFILDDPIKIEDAFKDPVINLINGRFTGTYASRLQHQDIPIILIMQRIKDDDPSGYLLTGGSGDMWHHLNLPIITLPKEEREVYNKEWTHGIPIHHDLPEGLLWPYKHKWEDIEILKKDDYTYNAQYLQSPAPAGGGLFKYHYWGQYSEIPKCKVVLLFADTATKKGQDNDYTVFLAAGLTYDDEVAILDLVRDKMTIPEVITRARDFWNKHKRKHGANRTGAGAFKIEDKSSGTNLIQQFEAEGIPVMDIQRNTDKVQRALLVTPKVAAGKVLLPTKATALTDPHWVSEFKSEHAKFTANDTHKHDDQIDTLMDAVETFLIDGLFCIYNNLR